MSAPLLQVTDLCKYFPVGHRGILSDKRRVLRAVDGVSFDLERGQTLGLVGESGSGKTTVGRAISNILRSMSPDVVLGGEASISYEGQEAQLNGLNRKEMLPWRAKVQMIFQDPFSSLNPRMTVQQLIERPMELHLGLSRQERKKRVEYLLDRVGLQAEYAARYPHEFSGGQRQRIGIARALSTNPALVIADEPVSAVDVSVQAQVINLMEELREEFGLTYIFVAHDLAIVYHIADRIAVMYLGDIVELGPAEEVCNDPRHPYTRALLSSVPQPDPRHDTSGRIRLEGDIPSPLAKPSGCGFRTRCPIAKDSCAEEAPEWVDLGEGRGVGCPHTNELKR